MNQYELALKKDGMDRAAKKHNRELEIAREAARDLARTGLPVSSDDVRDELPGMFFGNWAGSIFKGPEWERVGFMPSRHAAGHCRLISTWRLKKFAQECRQSA